MQQYARITSKGQTTIPKEVRDQLGLEPGDTLSYEVQGRAVMVRKVERFDAAWQQAIAGTLEEWNSPEDDEAFQARRFIERLCEIRDAE